MPVSMVGDGVATTDGSPHACSMERLGGGGRRGFGTALVEGEEDPRESLRLKGSPGLRVERSRDSEEGGPGGLAGRLGASFG